MDNEYCRMVDVVNHQINRFNKEYLNSNHYLPSIDTTKYHDNNHFTKLTKTTWNDLSIPNATKKGVYFIFGKDSNDFSKKAMYIGKASFSSKIGLRVLAHLSKDKYNANYTMNHKNGNIYIFEFIYGLDLESFGLHIFSSALEEFLIQNVKNEISLLNGTGN